MTTNTTRRTFIQGTSAAVAALSLPSAALAGGSPWETAKANYATAHTEMTNRVEAHNLAEKVLYTFRETQPGKKQIAYKAEGFTSDNGLVSVLPHKSTFELTVINYRGPNVPNELTNSPDYIAYRREADKWHDDPAHIEAIRTERRTSEQCGEAFDVEEAAYTALISTPVNTLDQLSEKVAMGCENSGGDETRMRELLKAISGDIARITGKQRVTA